MHRVSISVALAIFCVAGSAAWAASTAAPAASATAASTATTGGSVAPSKAYLYIGWPNDGEVIAAGKPFRVWFGLRNMGVCPKGVDKPNCGHHHLLVDTDLPPMGVEIPSDRNHLHFGAGETETSLELPPGKHTLQLLMGDEKHIPHNPPVVSKKITITVR